VVLHGPSRNVVFGPLKSPRSSRSGTNFQTNELKYLKKKG
jgi:hypothetical protein